MTLQTEPVRALSVPSVWLTDGGRRALTTVAVPLLALAAVAWTFTARADSMSMVGTAAFVGSWLVMMAAMMLPAVAPVVALYALASRRRVVAALPVFLAGYAAVWAVSAVPAYLVAQVVADPLMDGAYWASRLAGVTLLAAAGYQLTPLKVACLNRCRSPLSVFLTRSGSLARPRRAFAAGARHGVDCLGCCWALMAVLIVLGGMQLGWALAISLVLTAEKVLPRGPQIARVTAVAAAALGLALFLQPSLLTHLITM